MKKSEKHQKMHDMMNKMCFNMTEEECQDMMSMMMQRKYHHHHRHHKFKHGEKQESFATPELQMLFFEWCQQLEDEIKAFMDESRSSDVKSIAQKFNLTEESAGYLLERINSN